MQTLASKFPRRLLFGDAGVGVCGAGLGRSNFHGELRRASAKISHRTRGQSATLVPLVFFFGRRLLPTPLPQHSGTLVGPRRVPFGELYGTFFVGKGGLFTPA